MLLIKNLTKRIFYINIVIDKLMHLITEDKI